MPDEPVSFLVLEDVDVLRRSLVRALTRFGTVESAATCAEARVALRTRRFDSLVADVQLPDGCGLDVVPFARQLWPTIWVLVLTGSLDHSVVSRTHELGVRVLLKPFHPDQLQIHAEETKARRYASDRRIAVALDRWARGHHLTETETELLTLGARGVRRAEFAIIRQVQPDTIRKQIQSLLQKTGDETFEAAVNSLLREALSEPE